MTDLVLATQARFEEAASHYAIASIESKDLNEEEGNRVVDVALRYLKKKHATGEVIDGPRAIRAFLRIRLADRRHECIGCVFLTTRHSIIAIEELFQGTIDGATVHPRVVAQKALECNAAAVILFHNHPSGVAEPSAADRAITRRLRDALALLDIRMLDHMVVSSQDLVSMAERGMI